MGFLYGRKQGKTFRVLYLVFPTTTGSLKEVTDELKTTYFQLEDLELLGLAQGVCGEPQLCQKSKEVFVHFVKTLANNGVFLLCKVNGVSLLDPPERYAALFKIVEGDLQQQSFTFGPKHKDDGADTYKILTILQKYGTLDEDDVRQNIRGSLFQDAIGTTQGNDSTANTINIAEDLPVPLGDPISFHPDDEMCYEIRVPPDGLCSVSYTHLTLPTNREV